MRFKKLTDDSAEGIAREARMWEAYKLRLRQKTFAEIAETLGVSVATASLLVKDATKAFRKQCIQSVAKDRATYIAGQMSVIQASWEEIEDARASEKKVNTSAHLATISSAWERVAKVQGLLVDQLDVKAQVTVSHEHEFNFAEFNRLFTEALSGPRLELITDDGPGEPVDTEPADAETSGLLSVTG